MPATYRMTFTDAELIALSNYLDDQNIGVIASNKFLSSAVNKIKVQTFKCSVGAATPAYQKVKTVTLNDLHPNDLGFGFETSEFTFDGTRFDRKPDTVPIINISALKSNSMQSHFFAQIQPPSAAVNISTSEPSDDEFAAAERELEEAFRILQDSKKDSQ